MKRRRPFPAREQGAALLVVLAVVMLLGSLASLGLTRLRATAASVSAADQQFAAGLLAASGAEIGARVIAQAKARARNHPEQLQQPLPVSVPRGTLRLRFRDAGNCFNLNSLLASGADARPQAGADDLARLLAAAGVDAGSARDIAAATVARLQASRMLWADAAEWRSVTGVDAEVWAAARPLLCALPTREASLINLNSLRPADAPLLVAAGVDIADARRAIAARPPEGWGSGGEFWQQLAAGGAPATAAAQVAGTRSRWIRLRVFAAVDGGRAEREFLLDTSADPARIVASLWRSPGDAA